jgi:hypothetical protein
MNPPDHEDDSGLFSTDIGLALMVGFDDDDDDLVPPEIAF